MYTLSLDLKNYVPADLERALIVSYLYLFCEKARDEAL
jgi:hypothetical protein